ncbi:hypothetical protein WR25_17484 isoform H [Diploscapter pachys]|nr:hypothetical protein WR25_17484 isoform H [Diploscapter pachys]
MLIFALPLAEADCSTRQEEALFSRYLYTKQKGIPSKIYKIVSLNSCLEVCAGNPTCAGVNYNRRSGHCDVFDAIDGDAEVNEHVDFYKNLCVIKEVDTGVSAAANVPETVHKAPGNVSTKKGRKETVNATKKSKKPSIKATEHRRKPESTVPIGPPVAVPPEAITTICNYEGIKVQVNNEEQFSGVMFVKNKFDTCRVEVANSNSATLVLGLPKDFGMRPITLDEMEEENHKKENEKEKKDPNGKTSEKAELVKDVIHPDDFRQKREADSKDCGLVDLLNGTYKTTVVIQTNNLGIPGLVTSMDQLYEVSCDYSSMLGGKVQAGYNLTVNGPEANLIQPKGKIELGNPVLMQILTAEGENPLVQVSLKLGKIRNKLNVQAKLGDILELRWEIMAMDDELDFFVKECFAAPGVGSKNAAEKLKLIESGCPTPAVAQKLIPGPIEVKKSAVKVTKMQAFRFDSSSSIRITCEVEICKGDCMPVECATNEGQKQSWGRKKREVDNGVDEFETGRYIVPRYSKSMTSIVIIDPLQQVGKFREHHENLMILRSQSRSVWLGRQRLILSKRKPRRRLRLR